MSTVATLFTAIGGRVGYTISSTSSSTETQCIQFLNEALEWITGILAEEKSEIGRTLGSITTVADTASYSDLSGMYATSDIGWILKTYERVEIKLTTEESSLDYNPDDTDEPCEFYVDGSNNIVFLPTPDDAYTIKIPYWAMPTNLTATTDTVPFNGLFDNLLIEFLTMRMQNKDEYDLDFEYKWLQFLLTQARRLISMRKGRTVGVTT